MGYLLQEENSSGGCVRELPEVCFVVLFAVELPVETFVVLFEELPVAVVVVPFAELPADGAVVAVPSAVPPEAWFALVFEAVWSVAFRAGCFLASPAAVPQFLLLWQVAFARVPDACIPDWNEAVAGWEVYKSLFWSEWIPHYLIQLVRVAGSVVAGLPVHGLPGW